MDGLLGIGAIDSCHPDLRKMLFWHGMIDALRNTVNVPDSDPILELRDVYERGAYLRGNKSNTNKGGDCKPRRTIIHN